MLIPKLAFLLHLHLAFTIGFCIFVHSSKWACILAESLLRLHQEILTNCRPAAKTLLDTAAAGSTCTEVLWYVSAYNKYCTGMFWQYNILPLTFYKLVRPGFLCNFCHRLWTHYLGIMTGNGAIDRSSLLNFQRNLGKSWTNICTGNAWVLSADHLITVEQTQQKLRANEANKKWSTRPSINSTLQRSMEIVHRILHD